MAKTRTTDDRAAGLDLVCRLGDVSRETAAPLTQHAELLVKWQRSINLVSRSTLPDLWRRHMADSAQLVPHIRREGLDRPTILDLGSGAGFPGLVLAQLGAGRVHLVEADQRKASFLRQVLLATGAEATLHTDRLETLAPFPVDIVTARAFAPLVRLVEWAADFVNENTVFWLLKGREVGQELTDLAEYWTVEADRVASATHDDGVLLRLSQVRRRDGA
ncbi:16S rRNA (guanine(527)-N(7))-methyltransferase RsmG [Rhodothalassium salexigens]|uniref:16S rRNA (guanine(527)-N(7))-methyltransferase RsmG n=1 Tax=Rhodothalassium salexigens TaxID=1086 RepID=UPI0019122324|nr:16S rRNA (guanine(527)-N(7))-methyltransferase RsmG [Rhodothalassium salexigens]MBK5911538.1 16S rRNA (guanine(527)-N(7))-methyltransferase RsmG [Rhodothalassium salexigens]